VLNSNYSSFNNVTVVGIDGVTINNGFQYSSNGTGELIIDGDPMGIQSPDGNAPYYNPAIPGSNPRNLDLSLPVGTISGSAGVSPSGAGTYSIPINLPDAPNNMIPSIDISYNSQMDYGTLGKKWSLGGVSNISISGQSRYYDGVYLPLNENDSLCSVYWDGQRLLSIGGSGLKADTFRTEEKSNILITKEVVYYDTLFKILTPDGITMIYGNSENARMHYSDSIQFIWMLEKVYNRLGDTINYSYNIDTVKRQINLSKIEYGRGENGFLNEIQFHYIRTSNLSYTQTLNYLSIDDLLLDSISIMSNNAYFGSYGFQYDTSNNISLLKEIVQYDDDNNRYNSTKIDWESPVLTFIQLQFQKQLNRVIILSISPANIQVMDMMI